MESLATGHWLPDEHGNVVHARLLPDVKLTVQGEFETLERKVEAARWIAHCLNQAIEATPPDENAPAERVYLTADGVRLSPAPGAVEYVRADVAAALSAATGQLAEVITKLVADRQAERDRILAALSEPAHIALMPDECRGLADDRCYEMGAKNGGQAVRLAIRSAVEEAMKSEE
ncbi:hypothetical protein E5S69_20725 [Cupriavidus necator]|uniref:hypothetical protein n=1 Tax=Cupriavidus necator TaxID=106590 RepID=UPI00148FE304|nr:hypothetical protein [Cupriavidus necator]NOV25930.1 hypothetical protein [Cupriavidus necator]